MRVFKNRAEVAEAEKRATAERKTQCCFITYDNDVYDATEFAPKHPQGADLILDHAGGSNIKDDFLGADHSEDAREQLAKLKIGVIDPNGASSSSASSSATAASASSSKKKEEEEEGPVKPKLSEKEQKELKEKEEKEAREKARREKELEPFYVTVGALATACIAFAVWWFKFKK